jgi:hypothetical protein
MKILLKIFICIFIPCAVFGQINPKKLLIYYSYPSSFNYPTNGYNLDNVANDLKQYDYLVLGGDLELSTHPDHNNTISILSKMASSTTKVFGYIDLGVSTFNYSMSNIQQRIDAWKAMGVQGIFFDDFGYDYLVPRQRQNDAVNYTHGQNLKVIANGWIPDDVFGNIVNPTYNPTGTSTALNSGDFYLSESYLIKNWDFEPNPNDWKTKADKLKNYQQSLGFKILSITTNDATNQQNYDSNRFFYAWYGATIDNHEATGWGEYNFASCCAINALSPFRTRPNVNIGTVFYGASQQNGSEVYRYTNLGKIAINTSTHAYSFTPYTTCTSITSGSWHSSSSWSCGRVPFDYDNIVIKNGHGITVNMPSVLTTCQKILVEKGAMFDCKTKFLAKIN